MSQAVILLLAALAVFGIVYVVGWAAYAKRAKTEPTPPEAQPSGFTTPLHVATGFITNFFDTLGIGSFATTTAIFRFFKSVPDRVIPGTLNVGHTLPTLAQAFIFIALVQVELVTLVSMIAAAVVGAWLGAGVISKWPKRRVQLGMGVALLVAALLFTATNMQWFPGGGEDFALRGPKLYAGIAGNFFLGALMTLGIGLYAPCMILVALLGMNPTAAFPIMMGSCAFLMPVASLRFVKEKSYAYKAAIGLAIGGIPASIIAGLVVKSLDLVVVRWLVVVVVLYAAVTLLYSATRRDTPASKAENV